MRVVRRGRPAVVLVALAASLAAASSPSAGGTTRAGGGLIVFHQSTNAGPGGDALGAIWSSRPDGSQVTELREPCTDCFSNPRLSPDRSTIAYFDYTPAGDSALFLMNSNGTRSRIVCRSRCGAPIAWSPDSRRLAVSTRTGLATLDVRTRQLHPLLRLPFSAYTLDWSPDGARFVAEDDEYQVWVVPRDGRNIRRLGKNLGDPRWSRDGTQVLLVDTNSYGAMYVMSARGGKPRLVKRVAKRAVFSAVWSPDGTRIAYAGFHGFFVLDPKTGTVRRLANLDGACDSPGLDEWGSGETSCDDVDWR